MSIIDLHNKLIKLYKKQTRQNLKGKFNKARKTELKIVKLLLKLRANVQ